jgi:hypothetical protein
MLDRFLSRMKPREVALYATLLVPFGLLHAFVLAEICIGLVDVLFLAEMARERNILWARKGWFVLALVWWGWLMVCSLPLPSVGLVTAGWVMGFLQAFVIIRLLIFAVALQSWVLTTASARRWVWMAVALCCLWIGLESWQQFLTGSNIFGDHRWLDGSLTGPFWKPRAGALYGHLLFAALLPPLLGLYGKGGASRIAGIVLAILGVVTSVLIGQRMGTAFTILSLFVVALFVPQLRRVAAGAVVVGGLVLLATPIISPPTHAKLVGETSRNLGHFAASPYGELYTRAATMGLASPWHGWGYNGFRAFCPEDRFSSGFPVLGVAPTTLVRGACNLHPHNFYLQAFADAGWPGLLLFCVLNLAWLRVLVRGLWRNPEPMRLGLFIGVFTFSWPLASTDAFPTIYMSGWLFLMLGLGLAAAQISPDTTILDANHA